MALPVQGAVWFHMDQSGDHCCFYINDIDESVGCNILKFADDNKNFWEIKSSQAVAQLYEDLGCQPAWLFVSETDHRL